MSLSPVYIPLDPSLFAGGERRVAQSSGFTATAFRYRSGVAGLRLENGAGTVTLLPFQGQQIWDAQFLGRSLTMRSMFEEPQPTRDYLRTYGALFLHCGGTSMGNPGPADTHPLHGELPNLPYDSAELVFGEDGAGTYVDLMGEGRDTQAFHHDFVVRPRVRIRDGATSLDVSVEIENRANKPMPFLYLAHINFRPVDGSLLLDCVLDDRRDIAIRPAALDPGEDAAVRAYHQAVAEDPSCHRTLAGGQPVEPELVLTMRAASGADGWTHALHRHPNGAGDFVSYRPADLPHAVRWLTRGPDQDALGLVLPATAAPDGLAAATANRQLVWIDPGGSFRTEMRFGALDAQAARDLQATIASIRDRQSGGQTT